MKRICRDLQASVITWQLREDTGGYEKTDFSNFFGVKHMTMTSFKILCQVVMVDINNFEFFLV